MTHLLDPEIVYRILCDNHSGGIGVCPVKTDDMLTDGQATFWVIPQSCGRPPHGQYDQSPLSAWVKSWQAADTYVRHRYQQGFTAILSVCWEIPAGGNGEVFKNQFYPPFPEVLDYMDNGPVIYETNGGTVGYTGEPPFPPPPPPPALSTDPSGTLSGLVNRYTDDFKPDYVKAINGARWVDYWEFHVINRQDIDTQCIKYEANAPKSWRMLRHRPAPFDSPRPEHQCIVAGTKEWHVTTPGTWRTVFNDVRARLRNHTRAQDLLGLEYVSIPEA